tara:strand:- start:236 stop:1279 length:1044 start_codon:yes stop_codon:yes gene_type:complete
MSTSDTDKKHKCELCKYASKYKQNLTRHINAVHLKLKPFACPHEGCAFKCSRKCNLKKHVNEVHLKLQPFVCPHEGCDFKSSTQRILDQHFNAVHLKLKPYACPYESCEYTCSYKASLKKHVNEVHLKLKPFACPHEGCAFKCSSKCDLKKHVDAVHLKLKPYTCNVCDFACAQKRYLEAHVLRRHVAGPAADKLRQADNKRKMLQRRAGGLAAERVRQTTNKRDRQRYQTDEQYAMKARLRARMRSAIFSQGASKADTTLGLLGCTQAQLRAHIEAQFAPGMTWANRSEWHIDHIRPCASFDLLDESEQRACFHYSNLQPLWAADNMSKGSTYQGKRRRTQRVPHK